MQMNIKLKELSGKSEEELEKELSGVIFRDINCGEKAEDIPASFFDFRGKSL